VRPGLPETAGNLVTARRLASRLAAAGREAAVVPADRLPAAGPGPGDVVHALHAVGAGLPALRWAGGAPVVWTFTGTDLDPGFAAALREAVPRVAAVVAMHPQAASELRAELGLPQDRVRVIAPGVEPAPPEAAGPTAEDAAGRGLLLFLPAGIRAVKDPDLAVAATAAVRAAGMEARLAIAGPAREPDFHRGFLARLAAAPFARYLGELPREAMPGWYRRADLVLNTSRLEGLSNAVLEAMAWGRPVLATDIPGNRAAIRHGEDGWLAPPADLPAAAVLLCRDPALRARLGAHAREAVRTRFSPQAEVRAHLELYAAVAGKGERP
jgi:glycosyltransferase involved in cell wall biosynthesis